MSNLADIKLKPNSGINLNFPEITRNNMRVLIAGNTIGFFGYVKDGILVAANRGKDLERLGWLIKAMQKNTKFVIVGEIEEKEYYSELFNKILHDYKKYIRYNIKNVEFYETFEPKDYLEIYENVLKNMPKFNICLMNPPYGTKGDTIANRILNKCITLSDVIISIQPSAFITKYKSRNIKEENLSLNNFNKYNTHIEIFDNSCFDASIQQELAIININKLKDHDIVVENKFGIAHYEESQKINKYNNNENIKIFYNEIEKLVKIDKLSDHIIYTDPRSIETMQNKEKDENSNIFYITISYIRGNIGTDDMITIIPKNTNPKTIGRGRCYINFNTEQECQNCINYLQTDFARMCLWFIKNDTALAYNTRLIPWLDFSQDIFSKSPKEIDDYLFKKYNISDEIRKYIEEILPDYYGIRK